MKTLFNLIFEFSEDVYKRQTIMKKILFILGFVSLLVAGCSDFFDTAPSNKIPTTMATFAFLIFMTFSYESTVVAVLLPSLPIFDNLDHSLLGSTFTRTIRDRGSLRRSAMRSKEKERESLSRTPLSRPGRFLKSAATMSSKNSASSGRAFF